MEIKPIKTESDYQSALIEIEKLFDAAYGSVDGDKLDILVTLVQSYEEKYFPIDSTDPIEAIKFRMEQLNFRNKDLEPLLGTRGRVSEILNIKRRLTLEMIRMLHNTLHIPSSVLIAEYPLSNGA
jgi:HTH-type transcriptional regulator/antitoxin HigA